MALLTSESKDGFPTLIVDKNGDIGNLLSKKLSENSTVVLASNKRFPKKENIINISYGRKIPKIPGNIYSHIFVVDDGEGLTIEALPSFLKKAQSDKSFFIFITSLKRQKLPEAIFEYRKSRIIFLGDIFPKINFFPKSYVNSFLSSAKNRGRIDVPQDGMVLSYPVFLEDATSGILEASFGTSSDKVYCVLPKNGVTLLSLAHTIQKKEPDVKIDFNQEEVEETPEIVREGKYLLPSNYPLGDRIKNLNLDSDSESYEAFTKKEEANSQNLRLVAFGFIFFLFLPLLTTLLFSFLGFLFLDLSKNSLGSSMPSIFYSKFSFDLAARFAKALSFETSFIKLASVTALSDSVDRGRFEAENISGYFDGLDLFEKGKSNEAINKIRDFLVFAQSDKRFAKIDDRVFNFIFQTINVWPQILAIETEKKYLVLFQDDQLRGSGGRIEDLGILTIENGKISDFVIYKTQDLDKNLKGHVEPPYALRRYNSLLDFHLTDASFDADFKEVASSASFFLDLEKGEKFDGVISLNSKALSKVFKVNSLAILKQNLKGKNIVKFVLSNDFVEAILTKDVLFNFNDETIEKTFSANNFSSNLSTPNTKGQEIDDFFGFFQTDLQGLTLTKAISSKVSLGAEGQITSVARVELVSTKNSDSKEYMRIIVPQGSSLQKIKIDGDERNFTAAETNPQIYEAKNFKEPNLIEVDKTTQGGKEIFGFLSKVGKDKIQVIEAIFEYPGNFKDFASFRYNFHFFKQPGAESFPFSFSIDFPRTLKIYSDPNVTKAADRDFDLSFNFTK